MLRNTWWPLALAAGLIVADAALARYYPVRDEADLIQNQANLEKLNQLVKEINQRFGKEVLIETFPSVPAGDGARVKAMNSDARKRYFADQARERAKKNRVDGFYLFVNKDPSFLEVMVDNKTQEFFSSDKIRGTREILLTNFKKKEFDQGFLQAVGYIRDQLAANPPAKAATAAPTGKPAPRPTPVIPKNDEGWGLGGIICVGLVVLLVVWVIFALFRARTAPAGGGYAGGGAGMGGGGGGGGFMTGLLGGLFGAVAGSWMYHNLFGGGSHGGWGGSQAQGGEPGSSSPPTEDRDYSGSGGTWDEGGGDAGSDGSGGGDWGGGGGGDFGGGGGDW